MHSGLSRAIAAAGLTASNVVEFALPDSFYLTSWSDTISLFQILNNWLDENPKVDAVCCMHDHIAVTLINVLSKRGVRVPDDIAVTGHGARPEI